MGQQCGKDINYRLNGVSVRRYANPNIGWETAAKQNLALELGFLNNQLLFTAEYYRERRKNILLTRNVIPLTLGLSATPKANLGIAKGKGIDLSLDYKQAFRNGLWASARGNFTYATNKFLQNIEPTYKEKYLSKIRNNLNQLYGYVAERLFADDEEAANSPKQNIGNDFYGGGDIKYTDINGDGVVDSNDIVPIGYPSVPEIVYGFGFSCGYKGIDFSAFFQGQARSSFFIDAVKTSPFHDDAQLLKAYSDSHWSEDNQDMYALFPRLSPSAHSNNVVGSTWWLRDGSFLRLKQIEIGYSFPEKWGWMKKCHISAFRVYTSGSNLFSFSKFKMWDAEMGGEGLGYPIQRVFNIGINLTIN